MARLTGSSTGAPAPRPYTDAVYSQHVINLLETTYKIGKLVQKHKFYVEVTSISHVQRTEWRLAHYMTCRSILSTNVFVPC